MALSGTETGHSSSGQEGNKGVLARLGIGKGKKEQPQAPPRADLASVDGYQGGVYTGGPETTYKPPAGGEVKRPQREHAVSTELARRLSNNVREDLGKMITEQRTMGDAVFRKMYRESGHEYLLKLFDQFTEQQTGAQGRNRHIVEDKFNQYMNTREGMIDAYRVTMRDLQDMALPSAVLLQVLPDRPSAGMVDERNVVVGGDQGVLRKWARDVRHWGSRRYGPRRQAAPGPGAGAVRTGLANARNAVGNAREFITPNTRGGRLTAGVGVAGAIAIVNPMVGLGVAGGEAAYAGIRHGLRQGDRLETVRAARSLRAVLGNTRSTDANAAAPNPEEVKYMQKHLLIDPHDIEITGVGGNENVRLREGGITGTRIDKDTLASQINGYAKDILEFQKAMGIPDNQIEAMDIRFLLDGSNRLPQQGTPLQQRVLERFRTLGGVRDLVGRPLEIQVNPGEWQFNQGTTVRPGYNGNPDIRRNVLTWNKAFSEIMMEDMEHSFQRVIDGEQRYDDNLIQMINHRKGEQGPDSPAAQQRTREITEEQEILTASRERVTTASTTFTNYEEHMRQQRESLTQTQERLQTAENNVEIINVRAGTTAPATVEEALNLVLDTPGATDFEVRINGQVFGSVRHESTELNNEMNRVITPLYDTWRLATIEPRLRAAQAIVTSATASDQQIERANQTILNLEEQAARERERLQRLHFGDQIDAVAAHREAALHARTALREATNARDEARRSFNNPREAARTEMQDTVTTMMQARTNIEGWSIRGAGGIDLSTNALVTEPIHELLQRINTVNRRWRTSATPRFDMGWPEGQNERHLNELVLAIAEARASQVDPRINNPGTEFTMALQLTDLTELDFLALNAQEIEDRMNATARPPYIVPSRAEIEAIRAVARNRFTARRNVLPELSEAINQDSRTLTEDLERIQREGMRSHELEVYDRVGGRIPDIVSEVTTLSDAEFTALLDPNNAGITAPGRYNDQERVEDIAYVSILRWLADTVHDNTATYPGAAQGQEAAFSRARDVFTAAVINDALNDWRGWDINELQTRYADHEFTKQEFANFLLDYLVFGHVRNNVAAA